MSSQLVKLRLYVAGQSSNSHMALSNLKEFCRAYLPERHELEIIDVMREPDRALTDNIMLTPVLLVLSLEPPLRLVGNLSRPEVLRQALGAL